MIDWPKRPDIARLQKVATAASAKVEDMTDPVATLKAYQRAAAPEVLLELLECLWRAEDMLIDLEHATCFSQHCSQDRCGSVVCDASRSMARRLAFSVERWHGEDWRKWVRMIEIDRQPACPLCSAKGLHRCAKEGGRERFGIMSEPSREELEFARVHLDRPEVQEALDKLEKKP